MLEQKDQEIKKLQLSLKEKEEIIKRLSENKPK